MAHVSLIIAGPLVGNYEFTRPIPDADTARIVRAYGGIYGPIDSGEVDGNGAPIMRPRTPAEIVDALAAGFLQGVLDNTLRYETEQAVLAAAAASTPIEIG